MKEFVGMAVAGLIALLLTSFVFSCTDWFFWALNVIFAMTFYLMGVIVAKMRITRKSKK